MAVPELQSDSPAVIIIRNEAGLLTGELSYTGVHQCWNGAVTVSMPTGY